MLKTKEENPNGLHLKYIISKADGSKIDPSAEYFVLRLDEKGDKEHVEASKVAILAYADMISNVDLANDIRKKYGPTLPATRERITFKNEFEIKPILLPYGLEGAEYDPYFFEDTGDPNESPMWEIWNNFEQIDSETIDTDLEKGYSEISVILVRKSDNKLFEGTYIYSPYTGYRADNLTLVEVFPRMKLVTEYV